ncbi:MAG: hypothetical protein AB4042_13400, partial [Leptolyngbyaceae cyanobacterium]
FARVTLKLTIVDEISSDAYHDNLKTCVKMALIISPLPHMIKSIVRTTISILSAWVEISTTLQVPYASFKNHGV